MVQYDIGASAESEALIVAQRAEAASTDPSVAAACLRLSRRMSRYFDADGHQRLEPLLPPLDEEPSEEGAAAKKRTITKAELKKLRKQIAQRRREGEEVWTEDELEELGF